MQPTEQEQVLIRGKCFLYKQKAPFVPSGKSVFGALEYREKDDRVRCHECGGWFNHVGSHLCSAHKLTAKQYKQRHGLRTEAALCGLQVSGLMSAKYNPSANFKTMAKDPEVRKRSLVAKSVALKEAKERKLETGAGTIMSMAEERNLNGHCQAQVLNRLSVLQERYGRTPTTAEMMANGLSPKSVCAAFNLSTIKDVMGLIGMLPNHPGRQEPKYSKDLLVELMRDFYVKHNRMPGYRDYGRSLPGSGRFVEQFGSMANAYEAAGLMGALDRMKRSKLPGAYSRESVVTGIQRFYAEHGKLPTKADRDGLPSPATVVKLFGSMRGAWEAAGLMDIHNADRAKNFSGKDRSIPTQQKALA